VRTNRVLLVSVGTGRTAAETPPMTLRGIIYCNWLGETHYIPASTKIMAPCIPGPGQVLRTVRFEETFVGALEPRSLLNIRSCDGWADK
jgi:hypothetical protein